MYGGPQTARSPPPLQHPRPQHPPSHIPSQSPPPPDFAAFGSTSDYQRFASPPAHLHHPTAAAHHPYAHGGAATPDAYIPAASAYGQPAPYGAHPVAWMGGGPDSAPSGAAAAAAAAPRGAAGGGRGAPGGAGGPAPGQPQQPGWPGMGMGMGAGAGAGGGMGGMMNDATAQMGVQFGKHAFTAGQAYLDKNFVRLLPLAHLKHSFNVSNGYVLNKLRLVLWPWRHKPWSRGVVRNESTGVAEGWKAPRDDLNCPDLYIPVMAVVTYILLSAVIAGKAGTFDPNILGQSASRAFGLLLLEFVCIKLGCYLLGIGEEGTVVDLVSYEGYKFVGVIVALLAGLVGATGWTFWLVFLYVFLANFFFQLRSLRHLVLPDPSMSPLDHGENSAMQTTPSHSQRARRIQFLFVIAAAQGLSMGVLVRV
ncbi:protein transporter YIF1 [Rhodotorula paludigena]|uniref:protein transporter YIF1 n=1 Tax=Rhodotorula paludigena TaxID=86838 RepID=UPI003181CFC8